LKKRGNLGNRIVRSNFCSNLFSILNNKNKQSFLNSRRATMTQELIFVMIQIILVVMVAGVMFAYVNSVAEDITFEKKYTSFDLGLLMSVIQTAPGFIHAEYTPVDFSKIKDNAIIKVYFYNSTVIVQEPGEAAEYKAKYIQDLTLTLVKGALFNLDTPKIFKLGNKIILNQKDNSSFNLNQMLCPAANTSYSNWREDKVVLLQKVAPVPGAKLIVTHTVNDKSKQKPSNIPSNLGTTPISGDVDEVIKSEAQRLNMALAFAKAITQVESSKQYFKDGKMIIRMEPHVYNRESNSEDGSWKNKGMGKTKGESKLVGREIAGVSCQGGQSNEYACFEKAVTLNQVAAYRSISMGAGQVMGFNHKKVGYDSPIVMFDTFQKSAGTQIQAMFKFIENNKNLLKAAQEKDFYNFARIYNGDKSGKYAGKLETAYNQNLGSGSESSSTPQSAASTQVASSISNSISNSLPFSITGFAPSDPSSSSASSSTKGNSVSSGIGLPVDCSGIDPKSESEISSKMNAIAFNSENQNSLYQEIVDSAQTYGLHPAVIATFVEITTDFGAKDSCKIKFKKSLLTYCDTEYSIQKTQCSFASDSDREQLDCKAELTQQAYIAAMGSSVEDKFKSFERCSTFASDPDQTKLWQCIICLQSDKDGASEFKQDSNSPPSCNLANDFFASYCSWVNFFGEGFSLTPDLQSKVKTTSTLNSASSFDESQTYFDRIVNILTADSRGTYTGAHISPDITIGFGGPGDDLVDKGIKIFISAESYNLRANRKFACLLINELLTPESSVEFAQIIPVTPSKFAANHPLNYLQKANEEGKISVFIDLGRFAESETNPENIAYAVDNALSKFYNTELDYFIDGFTVNAKYGLQDSSQTSGSSCSQKTSVLLPLDYPDHLDYPEGRRGEMGRVWIPRQALCGGSFPLIISLHGWRSGAIPDSNIFVGPGSSNSFDLIAESLIEGGQVQPVIIAAPMDDPKSETEFNRNYWLENDYDINLHIEKISEILKEYKINIESISIMGQGNALCGGGIRRAVSNSDSELYLLGLFDGACNDYNYAKHILESFDSEQSILTHFHNALTKGDIDSENFIKGISPQDYSTKTFYSSNYNSAFKNLEHNWFTFTFKLQGDGGIAHSKSQSTGFTELLLNFFSFGKSTASKEQTVQATT
jgi:hypothetical protein